MYKYHFVGESFDIDSIIVDDMDRKFFKMLFFPVHRLHSLLTPVKSNPYTVFALETTTFSSKSATILVASLLLYAVFFDLNRFSSSLCSNPSSSIFPDCQLKKFFYSCFSV